MDFPSPRPVNQIDGDGSTPLHKAAADKTQHHLLKELVRTDSRLNCKDKNGDYPLLLALKNGCPLEVLQVLLSAGADPNVVNKNKANALHCALEGFEKTTENNSSVIKELCRFPGLFTGRDKNYETPFAYALKQKCNVEVFRMFWKRHSMQSDRDTLNHLVVPTLAGFSKLCNGRNKDGLIPLAYALQNNCSVDAFEVLWKQHLSASHYTPSSNLLISAVKGNCNVQIFDKILDKYKSMINSPDKQGRIPIHYVSHSKVILKRLIKAGSDLWHKDVKGYIPLSYCIGDCCPTVDVVRMFLKCMEVNKILNEEKELGISILILASIQGRCDNDVVDLLMDAGFSPLTNHFGTPAIEYLCQYNTSDAKYYTGDANKYYTGDVIVSVLRKYPDIFLIRKDLRNMYLQTPLGYGLCKWIGLWNSRNFYEKVVKYLAIRDPSLAERTFQPDVDYAPKRDYLDYLYKSLDEVINLKNLEVTCSKSLYDLIHENYMKTALNIRSCTKYRNRWKLYDISDFDVSRITIYKDDVNHVKDKIVTFQLYNERLCTRKDDGSVVFLTHLASKHILDYLDDCDLNNLADAFYKWSEILEKKKKHLREWSNDR